MNSAYPLTIEICPYCGHSVTVAVDMHDSKRRFVEHYIDTSGHLVEYDDRTKTKTVETWKRLKQLRRCTGAGHHVDETLEIMIEHWESSAASHLAQAEKLRALLSLRQIEAKARDESH